MQRISRLNIANRQLVYMQIDNIVYKEDIKLSYTSSSKRHLQRHGRSAPAHLILHSFRRAIKGDQPSGFIFRFVNLSIELIYNVDEP